MQLRNEKSELEGTLAREQEHQMEKLLKRIDRLQNEVSSKQETLDQVTLIAFCVFRLCCVAESTCIPWTFTFGLTPYAFSIIVIQV